MQTISGWILFWIQYWLHAQPQLNAFQMKTIETDATERKISHEKIKLFVNTFLNSRNSFLASFTHCRPFYQKIWYFLNKHQPTNGNIIKFLYRKTKNKTKILLSWLHKSEVDLDLFSISKSFSSLVSFVIQFWSCMVNEKNQKYIYKRLK